MFEIRCLPIISRPY